MENNKSIRSIILSISIMMIILLSSVWFLSDTTADNILNGSLQYSEELGWINWDHAKPVSTLNALHSFKQLNSIPSDSFTFSYAQNMKVNIANKNVIAEANETRRIKSHLNDQEIILEFLSIFVSVSTHFEQLQAKFPNSKISSFREGDLMGDLISFHAATSGTSIQEIKAQLTLFDTRESMRIYHSKGLNEIHFSSLQILVNKPNRLVQKINELITMANNSTSNFSTIVEQTTDLFIKNTPTSQKSN